ncbi:MAG: DUF357 domain-containing protein [Candidatus Pacearchaeota archaeon]|jgi:hypothetical protein
MENKITKDKLKKYFHVTKTAFEIIQKNIIKGKENSAKEIINMAKNYISDAEYFEKKQDYVNAFAALNYAHGWIDSGVRLGIFNVKDNKLFTIR